MLTSLLIAVTTINLANCDLSMPPAEAGETQAHGIILFTYPRNTVISKHYNGCQSQWFLDEDYFRKLSVVHFENGQAVSYDSFRIDGEPGYHCQYEKQQAIDTNDGRCPDFAKLKKESYEAGCYSKSTLDNAGSYPLSSDDCSFR